MSNATELKESNFNDTVANGVTLVDFWADWCGPCRMLTPIIDELVGEYDGKATISKVNVDEASELAQQFGVSSIPTLLVMKDGKEVNRFVGVTSKDNLSKALDEALS